ncbi:MAG: DUF554 domain-containing protein [Anaerolineales bacterium]|nr:DUF554 domain-containing protein [Anaerolineales bacterium]
MIGTLINVLTVLIGSTLGLLFGAQLPLRVRQTVIAGLGLFTAAIGIQMFIQTQNSIIVLGALLVGGFLGEWLKIETRLSSLGGFLEVKFTRRVDISNEAPSPESGGDQTGPQGNRFIRGFLTSSLLFCVGPMTILGSIQDGLTGDYHLLAIKSVLDGFASLAFASSLGVGVMFSTLVVFVFQGSISLLAAQAQAIITTPMMDEMTAVGGLLLIGLSISSLLEIKPIRTGNFLPALVIAPLIVAILSALGIG